MQQGYSQKGMSRMIKVAVCDDNQEELKKIKLELQKIGQDIPAQLWVKEFQSGLELLFYQEKEQFDIYLMDILMPDCNGIKVGKILRERGDKGAIIYLSSTKDFGVESYEVNAFYYLIKPISSEKLSSVLASAVSDLRKMKQESVLIKTQEKIEKIQAREIVYIESVDHNKEIHMSEKKIFYTRTTMECLWDMLSPTGYFVSTHRSYIVNIDYIFHLDQKELILTDGTKILVSRGAFPLVQEAYFQHTFFRGNLINNASNETSQGYNEEAEI